MRRPSAAARGVAFVLVGLMAQEGGAAIAVLLFPLVGPVGAVALRLVLAALVLWIAVRPRLRGHSPRDWMTVTLYGLVLAGMNVAFYLALSQLELGITVAIEVLGPLVLSVATGRRWVSVLWAVLAFAGVFLLGAGPGPIDLVGVLFALIAAALWAAYILLSRRTGAAFPGISGLPIGLAIGGIVVAPFAIAARGPVLFTPGVLGAGLAVAVLSSATPYALEMLALRRLAPSAFAVLMSLAPGIAALAGLILLGQLLSLPAWIGIALVVVASAGAVRTPARRDVLVAPG